MMGGLQHSSGEEQTNAGTHTGTSVGGLPGTALAWQFRFRD